MTQIEKLAERLRRTRAPVAYADVRRLLEAQGWSYGRQVGSHVTFVKAGEVPIVSFSLVSGRYVKPHYVRVVLKRLKLD